MRCFCFIWVFFLWRRNVNHSRSQQYPTIIRYQRVSKDVQFAYQQKCRIKVKTKLAPSKVLCQSTLVCWKLHSHSACWKSRRGGSAVRVMSLFCIKIPYVQLTGWTKAYADMASALGGSRHSCRRDALATHSHRDSYAYVRVYIERPSSCHMCVCAVRVSGDAGNFLPSRLT